MEFDFNFYEKIVDGWERTESPNGVPYYINHKTERTSWDHPYWLKIVEGLKEFDNIKYAAYRTAFKIKQLQDHLQLNHVELPMIRNEFEELGHSAGDWESVHCDDLLILLINVYKSSHISFQQIQEPEMLADLSLNLLLALFDLSITIQVCENIETKEESKNEFEELGHSAGDWESVHCDDLLILLINVYKSSHISFQQIQEPEMLADLSLNLLLALFDLDKTGFVPVMSAKIILVTLCNASLTEKYRYFYQELHDPSTYIRPGTLTTMVEALMRLPDFLQESLAFGRTSDPAVASCSQMGIESGGITEDVFYRWLNKEPQTIVWIPTFHRVASTQTVRHDVKCNVCKTYPIIGFRYKCLKCFNFDMCQACFFTGRSKKKHKPKHPMQEYCLNSTAKDGTAAFVKTLKYNLSRKQRKKVHQKYLPIEADGQYTNMAWSPEKEACFDSDIHTEISQTARRLAQLEMVDRETSPILLTPELTPKHNRSPFQNLSPKNDGLQKERDELNSIIQQLQEENRALYQQLSDLKESSDIGSIKSDIEFSPLRTRSPECSTPALQRLKEALKETYNLPVREPHPCEATPIYLSVPIIQLNGSTLNRYLDKLVDDNQNASLNSSGPRSAFRQPIFSSLDSSLPNTLDRSPVRERMLGASLDDLDASPSRFSLPSPTKSHDEFLAEEAELRSIVRNVNNLFPSDLSFTGSSSSRLDQEDNEVLQAADSVGAAMTQFVNTAVNIPATDA